MREGAVLDLAQADVKTACAALRDLQELDFWKIPELDLLGLAQSIEGLARLGYAAQVRVAGEIDTRHIAANFGSASTVALLRETLTISAPDARARVNTAKMVLPQLQPSGAVADPVLPELAAALADGLHRGRTNPDHRRDHQGCQEPRPRDAGRSEEGPRRSRHGHRTQTLRRVREIRRPRPWTWTGNPTTTRPTGSN